MDIKDIKRVLASQYLATLETLRRAIVACPDDAWDDAGDKTRFWRVAYHTLFFTDLYLSLTEHDFKPWARHFQEHQFLGPLFWENNREPQTGTPCTKDEVLEYLGLVERAVVPRLDAVDLDAPSGFHWLSFSKFEMQVYNIRHVQHHAAQLSIRLRDRAGIAIDWVGTIDPDKLTAS